MGIRPWARSTVPGGRGLDDTDRSEYLGVGTDLGAAGTAAVGCEREVGGASTFLDLGMDS
jgi:hypothetical protein